MQLGPARADDVPPFVGLLEDAALWMAQRGIRQWTPGSMTAQTDRLRRAQAAGELLIVRDAGKVLGGVCLTAQADSIWRDQPRDRAGYLSKLVVDRDHGGIRVGEAILEQAEVVARARGFEWLRLDCVAASALERYYQAAGYYPRGIARSHDLDLARHEKQLVAFDLTAWQPARHATLLFLQHDDCVLLIHKKRGHGAGKINGPGGMIEEGETPLEAALRETREEVGVTVEDAVAVAQLNFADLDTESMRGYVFCAKRFTGVPVETAEARPFWCPIAALPFDRMWDDDVLWLPRVLEGRRLIGEFLMRHERLIAHRLRYVDLLPF